MRADEFVRTLELPYYDKDQHTFADEIIKVREAVKAGTFSPQPTGTESRQNVALRKTASQHYLTAVHNGDIDAAHTAIATFNSLGGGAFINTVSDFDILCNLNSSLGNSARFLKDLRNKEVDGEGETPKVMLIFDDSGEPNELDGNIETYQTSEREEEEAEKAQAKAAAPKSIKKAVKKK